MSEAAAHAPAAEAIRYEIVTPTGRIASGACSMIVAPAIHGEVGILRNHAPYLAALATGELRVKHGAGGSPETVESVFVSNGFIEALDNKVIVLAEIAERAGAIDVARAEGSLERAKKRLALGHGAATAGEHVDRLRARRALTRAKERIKVSKKRTT